MSEKFEPIQEINGFKVSPGKYLNNGATLVEGGISFTIHSFGAKSCNLCLFHLYEDEPFVILPFPKTYRIGNTYSMIVYDIDPTQIEYAYQFDGDYNPAKGKLFDKNKYYLFISLFFTVSKEFIHIIITYFTAIYHLRIYIININIIYFIISLFLITFYF